MGKNQHVVPFGKQWAIKGEGNQKSTAVHSTQKDAVKQAADIAKN